MTKTMKKNYLLIFMFCYSYAFGQTYSFYLSYTVPTTKFCWDGKYGYTIYGDNNLVTQQVKNKTHYQENSTNLEYSDIPNYNIFNITIKSTCFDINGTSSCDGDYTQSISASSFIINGNVTLYRCGTERLAIDAFTPNVKIQNLKPSSIVCSGESLQLAGFPIGFPNEAYHWQYSLDNELTWIDVPLTIGAINTNNTTQTAFSIDQLLGALSEQYYNEQIYFRLGYNQNRPFSNVIPITYSPCGPTISSISYEGPKCNGDIVKSLSVTFEDKLNSAIGEKLSSIYVCDINDNQKIFMIKDGPLSYPNETKTYTYALIDLRQLENGHTYKIRYQAQIPDPKDPSKTIMRGVLESPSKLNFLYKEFEALKFEPVTKTPPLCHNGEALIELKVSGGAGDYYFTLDNEIEKKFTNSTTSIITTNPITKIETEKRTGSETIPISSDTSHSIKIRDTNYCIDKTSND